MASGDVQAAHERDEAVMKPDETQATPEAEAGDGGETEQPLSKNQLKKRAKYARYARFRRHSDPTLPLCIHVSSVVRGAQNARPSQDPADRPCLRAADDIPCRAVPCHASFGANLLLRAP